MLDQYFTPDQFKDYGMFGGILVGLLFGAQKALKAWKITDAETSVVSMMSKELSRLSAQNESLMKQLSDLQNEIVNVRRGVAQMTSENESLKTEVTLLTDRVTELNRALSYKG